MVHLATIKGLGESAFPAEPLMDRRRLWSGPDSQ
jgi:hypothetical protein